MIAIHEMFFYTFANFGEKTPRSVLTVDDNRKWPVMKDSNLLIRDEGIEKYNSENTSANLKPEKWYAN